MCVTRPLEVGKMKPRLTKNTPASILIVADYLK